MPQNQASDSTSKHDSMKASLKDICYSDTRVEPATYAFRDDDDLLPSAVEALGEAITANGLTTPLKVKEEGKNKYLVLDGHRRWHALKKLIDENVAGFSKDMKIPVHALPADTPDLDVFIHAVTPNVQRQDLPAEQRIRAAAKFRQLGMAICDIAKTLGVSVSAASRDVVLGADSEMLQHVQRRHITATAAAELLKAATDAGRVEDFKKAFASWLADVQSEITKEEQRRKTNDEGELLKALAFPQKHLTPEQVKGWKSALERKKPLKRVEQEFKFKALIRAEKGKKVLEIDPLHVDLASLSLAETIKLYKRLRDVAQELAPAIAEKHGAEKALQELGGIPLGSLPGTSLIDQIIEEAELEELLEQPEDVPEHHGPEDDEEPQG